jgi:predicted  nucleic acid-binding Zn-ribbon protein
MSDRPAWVGEIMTGISELRGEVAQLRGEVTGVRDAVAALEARLDAELAGIRSDLASVRDDLDHLRADIDQLRDRFDVGLPRLRGDLMDRIDRLQDKISAHHSDIAVNFASSDRAMKLVRSQREEIAGIEEQLAALTRLVHHLQGEIHSLRGG